MILYSLDAVLVWLTFNEYWENLVAVMYAFLNRFIFNRPPHSVIGFFCFFCLYIVFRLMTAIPAAFKQRDRSINLYFTSVHCSFASSNFSREPGTTNDGVVIRESLTVQSSYHIAVFAFRLTNIFSDWLTVILLTPHSVCKRLTFSSHRLTYSSSRLTYS